MADRPESGEFEIIARYFRPLAGKGGLELADDAAVLEPAAGEALVATTDTVIAGVHFFPDDPAEEVAAKLLRANLSDLAAMGARPAAYLLAIALPRGTGDAWLSSFARGLRADQERFGIALVGGDTTATPGPAVLTVAALGSVPKGGALLRSGAKAGDLIFVSGTIGDAALGLHALKGGLARLDAGLKAELVARYRLPEPRVELGVALRRLASAAIDVSDGLVGDLAHVCESSGLGAVIEWPRVPLSPAARAALAEEPELRAQVLGGGDDYELLFTAAPGARAAIEAAAAKARVPVRMIGIMRKGAGVSVIDGEGREIAPASVGYRHF